MAAPKKDNRTVLARGGEARGGSSGVSGEWRVERAGVKRGGVDKAYGGQVASVIKTNVKRARTHIH